MNTINYKDLKNWYLDNAEAKENAAKYFGKRQPSIHQTGFYSSPSWNRGYIIGIAGVGSINSDGETSTIYFEVVTQFGEVKAARKIYIPVVREVE